MTLADSKIAEIKNDFHGALDEPRQHAIERLALEMIEQGLGRDGAHRVFPYVSDFPRASVPREMMPSSSSARTQPCDSERPRDSMQ